MRQTSLPSLRRGYVAALAATVAWSSSGIFVVYLTGRFGMPPLAVAVWRNLIVTLFPFASLATWARDLLRLERRNLPPLLLFGAVLGGLNALFPLSVALNGASVATVLIYSAPLFSALAARAFLGERLGLVKMAAVATGIAGCVLVSGAYDPAHWQVNPWGIAAGLGTGLSFAAYGLVGRVLARRNVKAWSAMAYGFLISTVLMFTLLGEGAMRGLASSSLSGSNGRGVAVAGWVVLVGLSLGPTLGGHGLYNVSLAHLSALTATLITTLEPPITAVLAYFLLGERLGLAQLVGSGLVIAGVVAVALSDRLNWRRARRQSGETSAK